MKRILSQKEASILQDLPEKTVLLGGCFDIIHRGHIEFLNASKKQADVLIVLLESDATIQKIKGEKRPVNTQMDRALVLSHLIMVDYVICLEPLLTNTDYAQIVKSIKPDIIAVTKGDPLKEVKAGHAQLCSSQLIEVIDRKEGYSTTHVTQRLKR